MQTTIYILLSIEEHATVLSRIRDLVSALDVTSSSVASIVNACATALTVAQFSDLLQTPNVEGHTALYWAVVNNRREALSAFTGFISEFFWIWEILMMRFRCMKETLMNWANQFVASFRIRRFQKRLHTTQKFKCAFVARAGTAFVSILWRMGDWVMHELPFVWAKPSLDRVVHQGASLYQYGNFPASVPNARYLP
ncbi:hypothetical protein DFH29DRAFT_1052830 [Suillus ampliporus]|nr:hypothetical protein DFH29DRAFT_1052830 [Suillus ampliporus]